MKEKEIIAAITTVVEYLKSPLPDIDAKMVARSYRKHLEEAGERDEIAELDSLRHKVQKRKK